MTNWTIGSLAKASGVGIQTVRFYERQGLLPEPARRESGYRQYSPEDATRIRFIKRAQDLGFTLREIRELMDLDTQSDATCSAVQKRADLKIAEIEKKLKDLQRMRRSLKELSAACVDCASPRSTRKQIQECRVMDCFESGRNC